MVAQESVIRLSIAALLAGGHLLLNDFPGVGKTLLARTIAHTIGTNFSRIQFTPDLLPTDITGATIYNQAQGNFQFVPGPIFGSVVLADEINRASTRTQSALLEAMGEGQVTVDGQTHPLPQPFWVVATQNEVDSYGTFPLPHAQLDRFLMSLSIGYPTDDGQVTILERSEHGEREPEVVLTDQEVCGMQGMVQQIEVARPVKEYIARLLAATRDDGETALGVSPRGGVLLQQAAQAWAAMQGRSYVTPDDVKAVAMPVLSHRIVLQPTSSLSTGEAVKAVLERVPVPL